MKSISVKCKVLQSGQLSAKSARKDNDEELSSDDWSVVTNVLRHHAKTQEIPDVSLGFPYNFEIVF